jgi:hypothetical protein
MNHNNAEQPPQTDISSAQQLETPPLSSEQLLELRGEIRGWFEDLSKTAYVGQEDPEVEKFWETYRGDNPISQKISELTEAESAFNSGIVTAQHAEGAKLFFRELIDYVKQEEDEETRERVSVNLSDLMFSQTPNILNEMPLSEQFLITSELNRHVDTRRWIGAKVNNELAYELSIASDHDIELIQEKIRELEPAQKIEILNHTQTLAAISAGNGEWARGGLKNTKQIAETLESDRNMLVSLAAESTSSLVKKDSENPSQGFVAFEGDASRGRAERFKDEHALQTLYIHTTRHVTGVADFSDVILSPIASDAVGVFNKSLELEGVGAVEDGSLEDVSVKVALFREKEEDRRQADLREVSDRIMERNSDQEKPEVFLQSIRGSKILEREFQYLNKYSDDEKELLLRAVYDPMIREQTAKDLNVEWESVPLASQIHFLEYLMTVDREQYERLGSVMHSYEGDKNKFLDAFLATQYGEDYGPVILNIAESSDTRKYELLESYSKLNSVAKKVGDTLAEERYIGVLDNVSPHVRDGMPRQISEAIMRRGKDMLNTAQEVLRDGKTSSPFYDDMEISVDSMNDVVDAMNHVASALEGIEALLNFERGNQEVQLAPIGREHTRDIVTYQFKMNNKNKETYMSLQMRKFGAKEGEHDELREFDGEARINFLFSDKPIGTVIDTEHPDYSVGRDTALSIRLDREGKTRENGVVVENDSTRMDGEMSIDMGGVMYEDTSLPCSKVGRVIACGNHLGEIRKKEYRKEYPEYYHNRESFVKEFGRADVFAGIVDKIQEPLERIFNDAYKTSKLH